LILKKATKPLHFSEITNLINKAGFDSKIACPATVHNELILNDQYVLVGRGIYALKEWGYKEGTVVDVIYNVLEEAGKPMKKDDIVEEVLKTRMVKKSTVYLSLLNKAKFQKIGYDEYTIKKDA
jgi:DNA-directed RNA polymerase delta subunit